MSQKTVVVAFLIIITIILAGGAIVIGDRLSRSNTNPDDTSACINCPGGTCNDGTTYPNDTCAPQATCEQRHNEACAGHDGPPGTGTVCGNGQCEGAENANNCPGDCATPDGSDGGDGGQCIPDGAFCVPGNNTCCNNDSECTPSSPSGPNVCNQTGGGNQCSNGDACNRIIAFHCDQLDPDGTCSANRATVGSFSQGLAHAAGCGQVDTVCATIDELRGAFQIVSSSCGGGDGSDGGDGGDGGDGDGGDGDGGDGDGGDGGALCGNGTVDPGEECGEPGLSCGVGETCSNCSCTGVSDGGDGDGDGGDNNRGEACTDDTQCPDGHSCNANVCILDECIPANSGCTNNGCTPPDGSECGGFCTVTSDCVDGHVCNASNTCVLPICLVLGACSDNSCTPVGTTPTIPDTAIISDEADRVIFGLILLTVGFLAVRIGVAQKLFGYMDKQKFLKKIVVES